MSPAASDILALDLGNNQTLMLIALVVIIASLLWHNARRRSRRTGVETRTGLQARKHNARLERQAGADIGELMLRLEELSREICGQIDTRFAKLEHVVTESDVKLAEMQTALRKCSAAGIGEASPPADPKHLEIYQRHQAGQAVIQIAREMSMTA
ncbi:MAG: hypothetical protein HQ546_09910, partial [Planctomycetes bacterium]|nr:hypothetical protein [Planctomycetota bacterium]